MGGPGCRKGAPSQGVAHCWSGRCPTKVILSHPFSFRFPLPLWAPPITYEPDVSAIIFSHDAIIPHKIAKPLENSTDASTSNIHGSNVQTQGSQGLAQGTGRLDLGRRNLTSCLNLLDEQRLRFLDYQNNFIAKIEHLEQLSNLVLVDFYNNHITHMSGLDCLYNLKILILGKNRIQKIEGLDDCLKLEVLDLHANAVVVVENIGHLKHLRILNLEDNRVQHVGKLGNLRALAELNLRRNQIDSIKDVQRLVNLKRLILSSNCISSLDKIADVLVLDQLSELSLENNPLSYLATPAPPATTSNPAPTTTTTTPSASTPRAYIIHKAKRLKILDGRRVTEEERRVATRRYKREAERRREVERVCAVRDERTRSIKTVATRWANLNGLSTIDVTELLEFTWPPDPLNPTTSTYTFTAPSPPPPPSLAANGTTKTGVGKSKRGLLAQEGCIHRSETCFAEMEGGRLVIYGDATVILDKIDAAAVTSLALLYINATRLSGPAGGGVFARLRRFTGLRCLVLGANRCDRLRDVTHLATLPPTLQTFTVLRSHNAVLDSSLCRPYAVFRLASRASSPLLELMGAVVSEEDRAEAEVLFGPLRRTVAQIQSPQLPATESDLPIPLAALHDPFVCAEGLRKSHSPAHTRPHSSHHREMILDISKKLVQSCVRGAVDDVVMRREVDALWPVFVQGACLRGVVGGG
ncbi:uncharacterized protein EV422DRAFT_542617 [Fimicolochytrium jonesii]|uniref:uncharacterized protein n=1 Tax=Fimicolochytrium jonesii TaxID=1396493 RepID=UPI0022FF1FE7|nr:uncharacterized protein EV422DRAFT_542617 [Fimicolochytrium jonesii]KAI8817156.1 hypothetical protein EV422DRAFT_542617 [Fimicolochytrium jonesii]